ncbi:hypothetical protein BT69DRAFT_1277842 [Atractiella rhizophila]|nr:hypothetical protein BT69DRAFT_1277842 [Atractiella rhizophila]
MSSNSSLPSLLGGYPTHDPDTAASAAYLGGYGLLFLFTLYRIINVESRSNYYFILIAFIVIRTASLVIRIIIAEHNKQESTGVLIAEQILLSAGYLALLKVLSDLFFRYKLASVLQPASTAKASQITIPVWGDGEGSGMTKESQMTTPTWGDTGSQKLAGGMGTTAGRKDFHRRALGWLSFQAIIVAVTCAIVAATKYDQPKERDTVKTLRTASAVIVLSTCAIILLLSLALLVKMSAKKVVNSKTSAFVIFIGTGLLLVIPIYRLVTGSTTDIFSRKTKIELYLLQLLPEYLTACLLVLCKLKSMFDMEKVDEAEKEWVKSRYPNGRRRIGKLLSAGYF